MTKKKLTFEAGAEIVVGGEKLVEVGSVVAAPTLLRYRLTVRRLPVEAARLIVVVRHRRRSMAPRTTAVRVVARRRRGGEGCSAGGVDVVAGAGGGRVSAAVALVAEAAPTRHSHLQLITIQISNSIQTR